MRIKKLCTGTGAIVGYIVGIASALIGILAIDGELTIQYRWLILLGLMLLFIFIFAANARKILKEGIKYPIDGCESEGNNVFFIY